MLWCEYATVSTVVQIWYGNMFIDAVSSLFTIVSTATSYLTSLEGFDFEDFPQITSPTNLLTSLHASSVCASKLTISEDERSHFAVSAMSKPKWETLYKYLKSYQTISLVPRPRPAFRRFQYGKAGDSLVPRPHPLTRKGVW